ncbi:phosphoglycerate mutase [Halovenus aranensis]|uniref:2,3-bisphosphoglycerate-independent phosphoglycerate mutase n=1 Tax=Halovenus aranensis TaxID=890420 RepID=A0A1G8X6L9_9EURY|nr:2,3-bisphosphoglycerate-independent phosphoglycerate mutase [Halovenus aranensis]SDJ85956.1 phosphoglycerate mutase [Halovenus aranensis]
MDVGLVVLDGWGLNADSDVRDAVAAAETPTVDGLRERGATGTLTTDGRRVGLPEGQMGNSEVGHLNIGAGRVVTQESARITDAIARWRGESSAFENPTDPPLSETDALASAVAHAEDHGGRVHLLGLVSDGGVHSYQSHLHALIDLATDRGVEAVTHAFTDGRDTSPTGGREYLRDLAEHAEAAGTGEVATVCGRYYAMDRDENWERTKRAYDAIVDREAAHTAPSAVAAVEQSYDRGDTDEFVEPTLVEGGPALRDGDSAIFVNFRADRARQLTRLLADIEPEWSFETTPPDCRLVTMTEYDSDFDVGVAFPAIQPEQTLGEVLAEAGRTQLRIAETEKYAHVTYFLDGGREVEFDGERREIVPSPDVATYDQQPAMSAPDVTDRAVEVIDDDDPDVVVLNYANPDMVGHTGDFEAAVAAVEAVDTQLARLVEAMQAAGADVLVTADHGNADDMGTVENPQTAHTTNPVPFVYVAADADGGRTVREDGALEDIAPTVLDLLSIAKPDEMTGESLLE